MNRIAVDVGGTFTDAVITTEQMVWVKAKSLSTPEDPSVSLLAAVEKGAAQLSLDVSSLLSECEFFILGSTIATNALLENKGARVGLICTKGFRDDVAIRRGYIPAHKDFREPFPSDLVPRRRRLGVTERIDKNGEVFAPLEDGEVIKIAQQFCNEKVDSVAVCLLNSFLNPSHEAAVKTILRTSLPEAHVSISSEVLPIIGEYPRSATTVMQAYVAPRVIRWLRDLEGSLASRGFQGALYVMQNNGGLIRSDQAIDRPVLLVLSGPAAAAPAAADLVKDRDEATTIVFDMGGTSTDITILKGEQPEVAEEMNIGGYDMMLPSVDVYTVAAGGGAIAHVDVGGLLRSGPQSAGATPGHVALGQGGEEPTTTDANLLLGRLNAANYAGGEIRLYPELSEKAFARLGDRLDCGAVEAALGAVRIAEETTANAIMGFCLRKGVDPSKAVLVSAGGAGGLHAVSIAGKLGIGRILIPRSSAVFCASGMMQADLRRDFYRAHVSDLNEDCLLALHAVLAEMREAADAEMRQAPWPGEISYEQALAMRYRGQTSYLEAPYAPPSGSEDIRSLRRRFEEHHEERYGHVRQGPVQMVRVRLTVKSKLERIPAAVPEPGAPSPVPQGTRKVTFSSGKRLRSSVYSLDSLGTASVIRGPAVIEAIDTTILVPPDATVSSDSQGILVLTLEKLGQSNG